jgi:hypothetical protein
MRSHECSLRDTEYGRHGYMERDVTHNLVE